ncbi:protein PXR1 [Lathyrus oleraceus]|nr:protein PXR1-like [Pisum sativum]
MSRCLPFPPPNYMKNGIGGEALLQQLEVRRVKYSKEKKEEKKEKKRSHGDKKKDDKESEKDDSDEKKKERRRKEQKHDVEKMETHLEYTNLTMNWVPLEMQMIPTDLQDEEEWLSRKPRSNGESESKTAHQTELVGNRSRTDNGDCHRIQPLATYLPNADVYALPYALPF